MNESKVCNFALLSVHFAFFTLKLSLLLSFKPVSRVSVKFLLTLGVIVMDYLANFWLTRNRMRMSCFQHLLI